MPTSNQPGRIRRSTASALLLAALASPAAMAAAFHPDLSWRTLHTEHFRIHFHGGEEALANELALRIEDTWDRLTTDMGTVPRRPIEVVLVDSSDDPNGFALTLPVNAIVMYVTAPTGDGTLGLYGDWFETITTHELAHILHLDTVGGLPRVLRTVFGRVVSVNHLSPWWIIEGQATYHETRHTLGGRGRNEQVRAILRTAALEGAFPDLGQMDGWISDWPGGNLRYLFGQSFLQWIADHTADDIWTRWNHVYGSQPPWLLPARRVFGRSFRAMYLDWRAELEAGFRAEAAAVRARGETAWVRVSDGAAACTGPRFSPDGRHLAYACNHPATGPGTWVAGPDGRDPELVLPDHFAGAVSWRADGEAFVFAAAHVVDRFNVYDDIYHYELGADRPRRLTTGARLREPALRPDGERILAVRNASQETALATLTIDQAVEDLAVAPRHGVFSSPAWSPGGRWLAVSLWQDGMRDIWIFDAEGRPWRRVTADAALDLQPSWSPDGRWLLFSSDRSGIPNLYAVDLETEHLHQVTDVTTAAHEPQVRPDLRALAFRVLTAHGPDIALMPFDPAAWRDLGPLPRPLDHPGALARVGRDARAAARVVGPLPVPWEGEDAAPLLPGGPRGEPVARGGAGAAPPPLHLPGLDAPPADPTLPFHDQPVRAPGAQDVARTVDAHREETDYPFDFPVERYDPLATVLPPRYLAPLVYQTAYGFMGVLATGGVDVLRRHAWSAYLSYRTDAAYLGGGASYVYNRWLPVFGWGATTYAVAYGDVWVESPTSTGANVPGIQDAGERYWDRRVVGWTSVSYPTTERSLVYARWTGTRRDSLRPLPDDAYTPWLPTRGFLSSVAAGWRYAFGQAYAWSVSPEDSRSVAAEAQWTPSWLGSRVVADDGSRVPFDRFQLTGEVRAFVGNRLVRERLGLPWPANHVLGLRLAGGLSIGDRTTYGSFRLGGNYGESGYYALPDEIRSLRGYPLSADSGENYLLGSAEYRFPLRRIDRGPGALPLFLGKLHGAVFVDAGEAFDALEEAGDPLVGVGAELRLAGVVGWAMGLQGRLGYAVGLTGSSAIPWNDPGAWYLRVGTSF